MTDTKPYRFAAMGAPSQIVDLLDIDPGWWTEAALCERFPHVAPNTIHQALMRLTAAGVLKTRPRQRNDRQSENEYTLNTDD